MLDKQAVAGYTIIQIKDFDEDIGVGLDKDNANLVLDKDEK